MNVDALCDAFEKWLVGNGVLYVRTRSHCNARGRNPSAPHFLVMPSHGQHIAVLVRGARRDVRITDKQREWLLRLTDCGWRSVMAFELDDAIQAVEETIGR